MINGTFITQFLVTIILQVHYNVVGCLSFYAGKRFVFSLFTVRFGANYLINAALNVLLNIVQMIGFIVDDTYPNQRHTSVTWSGTGQSAFGHTANTMFNKKNGDQHSTNVKNTTPNTLLAFCSVLTALAAAKLWRFCRLARNLETNIDSRFFFHHL